MHKRWLLLAVAVTVPCFASPRANWTGPYRPCAHKSELLKNGHMEIGVRIETTDTTSTEEIRRALRFWSKVLDISVYEEPSDDCTIAFVDATPEILAKENDVARAQFTDWTNFQGWIAFDPHISAYMGADEIFATAVHELGHIFGLVHSANPSSVMYYLDVDADAELDQSDVHALAERHAMRATAAVIPLLYTSLISDRRTTR